MINQNGTSPERKRLKRLLLGLLALGVTTTAISGGTLAAWTATTTNPNNQFTTGSVTMTNVAGTVIAGSNCAASTSNGTCATLFGSNSNALKPGGADVSNSATITYTGTVSPTSDFRLYAANYTSKTGGSAASCTAANPGSQIDLQVAVSTTSVIFPVQSTTLSAALTNGTNYSTLTVVALGSAIAAGSQLELWSGGNSQVVTTSALAAAGATSISVTAFNANANYPVGTQVLPGGGYGSLDTFATTYTTSANGLVLKGGVNGVGSAGQWATNDNSIFNLKIHLDSGAGNTYQGCQSQSDVVWWASQ